MIKICLYITLILMTMLGSIASLFLKKASGCESIRKILLIPALYIGGFLYLSSAVLNIVILKYLDYSIVLPMTSITYIWTLVFSYRILKERITKKKIVGVAAIFIGVIVIVI